MKVRNGFVSNSSSSSFAIFGIELNEDELERLADENDYARDVVEEAGLEFYSYDGDGAAVGISVYDLWRQLPEEMKQKALEPIKSKLEALLKKPVVVGYVAGEYPT